MNLSAISAGLGFKGNLPKLPPDMEWAKDPRCPEGGLYPRKKSPDSLQTYGELERAPEQDGFKKSCDCEQCADTDERHYSYTEDNRRRTWEG